MTDHPPPQVGFAYPPQPGSVDGLPRDAYTPWLPRVIAYLIDYLPFALINGVGWAVLFATQETACIAGTSEYEIGEFCATGASPVGQLSLALAAILALGYLIWNLGYRQGRTGSSIGKSVMKFKVVAEKTGQPIGFGMSVVRELVYLVAAGLCGIVWLVAVLLPLWDHKRQSLADKIVSSICLPL
ncbi:RDD family protein [Mycobacterium deserti]|uniref:RDD family protein n=1 Tax=Mycobacterium deserti TaxID=2978347 RepID=UPI0036F2DBA9